jgi:hypothetical protein
MRGGEGEGEGDGDGDGDLYKKGLRAIVHGEESIWISLGKKPDGIFMRMRDVFWFWSPNFGHTDYLSFLSPRIDVKITL